MKKLRFFGLLALAAFAACAQKDVLVTIGQNSYTVSEFKQIYQFAPTDDSTKRMEKVDEFINQKLCVREARDKGYVDDPVVKAAFETNSKDIVTRGYWETKVVDKIKIPDSEIRGIYDQVIDQYKLAHIVFTSDSLAAFVGAELKKGVAFEALLKYSLDTLNQTGDIGSFSAIAIPKEILATIKNLKAGEVTQPVKYADYYQVIKVIEHTKLDKPAFAEVKEEIKSSLIRQKSMDEGDKFAKKLIDDARIEYNDKGLDALVKPDSLLTPDDLNQWVVKKYDTSYVYVKNVRSAVLYQFQMTQMPPKQLIDRVLVPDLIYEAATRAHADKFPGVKKNLASALDALIYQKFYSDMVIEKVAVDSAAVKAYFAQNQSQYPNQTFDQAYTVIYANLRDEKAKSLQTELYAGLRRKYEKEIKINEPGLGSVLKETK
jgi:hypothetical protein